MSLHPKTYEEALSRRIAAQERRREKATKSPSRKGNKSSAEAYAEIVASRSTKKPRKRMRAVGKKGRQWANVRRNELKPAFEAMGVTSCELRYENCANDDYLGFAHAAKRRKLSVDDLNHVILACNFCHDLLEVMPPEEMQRIVDETIHNRIATATSGL